VKIAPEYGRPTVHVLDASRVVGVVSDLLDPVRRERLDTENRQLQDRLREQHAERARKPLLPIAAARENHERVPFDDLPVPSFTGTRTIEPDLETLRRYVDWQFFFHAWELKGKFPAILEQPAARELYDDAQELLDRIVADESLVARGVHGFWPARADGDDIVVDGGVRFHMLRQQAAHSDSRPNRCLADYVSAEAVKPPVRDRGPGEGLRGNREVPPPDAESGVYPDHIGAFAVGIHGADELADTFAAEHDDYRAIMVKALADRFAEAFAEYLHERARREWYEPDETLSTDELIAERFRGIRPAFGYPACPDHSEKGALFDLLGAERVGLALTESFAMMPAAAVSGIYLAHPRARYFSVGRIGRDQVEDYATRKGVEVAEVERWLGPNLSYEP
jgi:5-methyltetrahydrofolate--homocysteine methyltransferase